MKTNARLLAIPLALSAVLWGCEDRVSGPQVPGEGPVFAKGGNAGSDQPTYTITFHFPGEESSPIFGDERVPVDETPGTDYADGECGVGTLFFAENPILNTAASRIKTSEYADCGGKEPRAVRVRFQQSFDADGQPVGLDSDGQTVDAKWFQLRNRDWTPTTVRDLPRGQTLEKALWITFFDQGSHTGGNGFGEACPALLRFDRDWGASGVQVTRLHQQSAGDDYDEWEIKAAPGPDGTGDVAACVGGNSSKEWYVQGYYHLPFQVDVVCKGDC